MSIDLWIKEMWYMECTTMEYYWAIKKNEIVPLAATWMEIITLNEVSQRKINTIRHHLYMKSKKNYTNELIYKQEHRFERWANSTKQLLNAGRGHQAPRKAAHCLWKQVAQNIKDKKRGKRCREEEPSGEGSLKKEKFPNTKKHSHWHVWGKSSGQHNREEK